MKVSRTRYIAVRDNKTKVLMDRKGLCSWKNGRKLSRQEQIDDCWRKFEEIGQARMLSWHTKNTALSALKDSFYTENVDYEIIEMTESFEIKADKNE